jgi:hypothetical protein
MESIFNSLREASHRVSGPAIIIAVLVFTIPLGLLLTAKAASLYRDSREFGKPPIVAIVVGAAGISMLGIASAFLITTF